MIATLCPFTLWAQFDTGTQSKKAQQAYEAGLEALQRNQIDDALDDFIAAVELDARYIDAYLALARTYVAADNLAGAIGAYSQVLDLYPRSIEAHQQLAATYQQMEAYDEAVEQYQLLLQHYPGYPKAYDGMARAYYAQKNYQAAIVSAEQAMAIYLRAGAYREAADARMIAAQGSIEIGEYEKALKYIKASKKQMEGTPAYYYYLGYCYYKMGKKEKAAENLRLAESLGYRVPDYLKSRMDNWE